jgi:hypothetical protein
MRNMIAPNGRAGIIVPSGIATDDTTKFFFGDLVEQRSLVSLFDFENKGIFPAVHSSYKFSLLTMSGSGRPIDEAEFVFFAHETSDLRDDDKRFKLSANDLALLNPNTRTCPVFETARDARLTRGIHARIPVLLDETVPDGNPWGVYYVRLVDYGDHASELRSSPGENDLPVYEGKQISQYDHRFASFEGTTFVAVPTEMKQNSDYVLAHRYWVGSSFFEGLVAKYPDDREWFLGYRDVARSTDVRTIIAAAVPRLPASRKLPILGFARSSPGWFLLANLNCFVLDYIARQKVGGISVSFFVLKQLPVLPPTTAAALTPWDNSVTLGEWTRERVLELSYTARDLESFANDLGYSGKPFRWDDERRAKIRAELDAAFFHLYELARGDVEHVMDCFPIVRRNDERDFGTYRTRDLVLDSFDAISEAATQGRAFASSLEPPPAATPTSLVPRD